MRLLLICILFLGLCACKKENENSVTFSISSPEYGSYYFAGDTLWIQGSIVAVSKMHGMSIQLLNDATDSVMFSYSNPDHAVSYVFSQYYVNQVTQHVDVRLEVTAALDREGNEAKKTMLLHFYP